ncbi:hypothetical protein [Streptomyces minutiscleroticus]|uniref:Secreted protein n=1 Tax=Streptomyces minutiscleroticus TaxID=68238 RepID=A0A918NIK1_9ACTN|nr:hypothetical protein [Streptomyces minutiscleroticus]GGX70057.1 hypothetical protein GCM10010358_25720 [Streptomyces minutiscleroticus]
MFKRVSNSCRNTARIAGAVAAGTALMVGVTGGTANAATGWTAQYTSADMVGVHAWGTIDDGERYILNVNVKDTAADSHGARVRIRTTYSDGGVREENLSASGLNAVRSTTWNYAANATRFQVKECLTEAGVDYACGSWSTFYQG